MGNSQAISSEDVFGTNSESNNYYEGESMTDKLKDMALNFTLSAAEKAKENLSKYWFQKKEENEEKTE